ncbi:hypothetical protein CP532_6815 [Ophiocordyceps camponoti-leonardi (nom. inval.)]|nr:hypothetical protein CP532_6815 [Ophiocordyceps camponoti-leonardi (nom. inval.)]
MSSSSSSSSYNPIHPSVSSRINSQYAAFYEANLANVPEFHLQPISVLRAGIEAADGVIIPGGGPLRPVGKTEDHLAGPNSVPVRCFTPDGSPSEGGWPAMLYIHGGGWVFGNIDTENQLMTNICATAKCVVVAVDYRLAPENPFPAAVEDAWQAALWLTTVGPSLLSVNPDRLCVGGASAGGNLAAVLCQRAASIMTTSSSPSSPSPRFRLQLLLVPVTDNTADPSNTDSWARNAHAPSLSVATMLWCRNHYLPDRKDWSHPEASPLLWTGDWSALPPAVIVLAGVDVLRDEGDKYACRLGEAGVGYKLRVFESQPHGFIGMDAALEDTREAHAWVCEAVRDAMYPSS